MLHILGIFTTIGNVRYAHLVPLEKFVFIAFLTSALAVVFYDKTGRKSKTLARFKANKKASKKVFVWHSKGRLLTGKRGIWLK